MASLLGEIKRRKVFQVAAVYAVVAWLTIQIVDVVGEPLNLPDWVDTVVIVLFAAGFPIAVILAWAFDVTPQGIRATADEQARALSPQPTGQRLNYVTHALVLLAVGFLVVDQYVLDAGTQASASGPSQSTATSAIMSGLAPSQTASGSSVQRLTIDLGDTIGLGQEGLGAEVAISPDGSQLVFATNTKEGFQLHLRRLDQFESQAMPGTEVARMPFFSPDGEWIGYVSGMGSRINKVAVRGGPPQTLVEGTATPYGGSWETEDHVIYSDAYGAGARLMEVSARGGTPDLLVPEQADTAYTWPETLPGGAAVLLTTRNNNAAASEGSIAVLSADTGEIKTLIPNAFNARYAPTGHLVFARTGSLWAAPFDAERLEITGNPVPVVDGVEMNSQTGHVAYDFSDDGLLVYVRGRDRAQGAGVRALVWVDREGREEYLDLPPRSYLYPRLSPDGQRLAVSIGSITQTVTQDIWIYDLGRGTESRLTFDATAGEQRPIWTPDGERVAYYSSRAEPGIFRSNANGTGQEERLTSLGALEQPEFFSPDGSRLVFRAVPSGTEDLYSLSLEGERVPAPLLAMDFTEGYAAISPDGHWIAYSSNETETFEVYVRPFPNVDDGKWQVSTAPGGFSPRWGPDGRELFYRIGGVNSTTVMAVKVETGDGSFTTGTPEPLFTGPYFWSGATEPNYDISADGQRFLMTTQTGGGSAKGTTIAVVNNWFDELERLAPAEESRQ